MYGAFDYVLLLRVSQVVCSSPVAATKTPDITPVSNKEVLSIQATLKRVRDTIISYTQMHSKDKC